MNSKIFSEFQQWKNPPTGWILLLIRIVSLCTVCMEIGVVCFLAVAALVVLGKRIISMKTYVVGAY